MDANPMKFRFGNTLIYEPSGRMHFVNVTTHEYFWTARTKGVPNKLVRDGGSDYFDFKENDNNLFYFSQYRHKKIDCKKLKEEVAHINEDRAEGDRFHVDEPVDSTFWIDWSNGNVYFNEQEVATKKYDMFEIRRKNYHIWHDNKQQMDVHFCRIEKSVGPCVCKPTHVEADYAPQEVNKHGGAFCNSYQFTLEFRDYVDLLEFERSHNLPTLEKDNLITFTNQPVHGGLYHGLYQNHVQVVLKEFKGDNNEKTLLLHNLFKLNGSIHFVPFFGIYEFEGRSYLVFESFDKVDASTNLSGLSKKDLLHNLKGLIRGVAFMQTMTFSTHMWGNIDLSSVVLVKGEDSGPSRLKIFLSGLGVRGKHKMHDREGLAHIIDHCLSLFASQSPESQHLVQCLRTASYNIKSLIEHPTFWTAFEKLEFICCVFEVVGVNFNLRQSLDTIREAVANFQNGKIDFVFFLAMESSATYAIGRYKSKVGQLVRLIRHAKIHDLDLKQHVRVLYGKSREGLEEYFRVRYPNLVSELYKLVQRICARHDHFLQFDIPKYP